jgi:predicted ATPase
MAAVISLSAAIQREIGTREDFPVYSEMLAEILVRLSETDAALALLAEAEREAGRTGHLYWLPELCRRRALVGAQLGAEAHETAALLNRALCVAREQNAATLFLSAYETAVALGISHQVDPDFRSAVPVVRASVEQGGEMAELLASISSKMDSNKMDGST